MQQAIPELEDLSFSYSVLEGDFAHIRGYLHSSSKIAEMSVQGWFSDARIPPEITRWTPVWPGKYRDWRQNPQIQAISAAMQPHASLAKSSLDIWPNFLWTSPTVPP